MRKIFVFAFDTEYPRGGFNDLKGVLDYDAPGVIDMSTGEYGPILRAMLLEKPRCDFYQVVIVEEEDETRTVQTWVRVWRDKPLVAGEGEKFMEVQDDECTVELLRLQSSVTTRAALY